MRNSGLEEAQAEIKITGRNINNLGYVDDTTLMAESARSTAEPESCSEVRKKAQPQKDWRKRINRTL